MGGHIKTICCSIAMICASVQAKADDKSFDDRVRDFILENPEIIVEALTILSEREAQAALTARLREYPDLFSERTGLGEGALDAPLRVIEFFDYRCAPCKAIHPRLVSLVEQNPNLRIEMRHLPILSPGSERAARFSLATQMVYGDEAYTEVHNALWALRGPLDETGFRRIAAEYGVDYDAIEPAMSSDAVSARIVYNRDVAIALEIVGTPAFVTTESVLVGSTDVEALAEVWLNQ